MLKSTFYYPFYYYKKFFENFIDYFEYLKFFTEHMITILFVYHILITNYLYFL